MHKDLLAHVKSLENDLTEIGQTLGDGTGTATLSNDGFVKQTENGKRLLQQLQAMKNASISSAEATTGDAVVPKATAEVDSDGKVKRGKMTLARQESYPL